MATTKKIQIRSAIGTDYDVRDIGAESQYVEVSRDALGNIIEDITTPGVEIETTEGVSTTLKNIEDNLDSDNWDTEPTKDSTNFISSGSIYNAIQPDDEMSTTSTNTVQNKIVTNAINRRQATYLESPTSWDTTPTQNSTKPVTSGGVYNYIDTMITQAIAASY